MSLTADRDRPADSTSTPSVLGVGTVVWLASELMFFAGLFAAYFTLRSVNPVWPPDDVDLPTLRTAVATLVLVASSGTMHLAVQAVRHSTSSEAIRRGLGWLGVTAMLGVVFLSNQALEYLEAPFALDDHAYGSIFYLLTGFHGLHVLGGLVLMGAVAVIVAGRSPASEAAHPTLEVCGYYWHFVDAVWVAMFTTIYLVR